MRRVQKVTGLEGDEWATSREWLLRYEDEVARRARRCKENARAEDAAGAVSARLQQYRRRGELNALCLGLVRYLVQVPVWVDALALTERCLPHPSHRNAWRALHIRYLAWRRGVAEGLLAAETGWRGAGGKGARESALADIPGRRYADFEGLVRDTVAPSP